MNRLDGKTALVTGAAHGIGQAIAETFAEEGAWVVVTDIDREGGEAVAAGLRERGFGAMFVRVDVSHAEEVRAAVETAAAHNGRIDILCNNAAYIGAASHGIVDAGDEEWERNFRVTVFGTQQVTRAVVPYMVEQKQGSVITVASIQALVGCPESVAYTTMKAALLGFNLSGAYDYGKQNVRFNVINPGPIQTRIAPKPGEPAYDWQCGKTMLGRVGYPKEVAWAAVFLASDEASYITGSSITVDGGWVAK